MSKPHHFQGSAGTEDGDPCSYPIDAETLCGRGRTDFDVHLAFSVTATNPGDEEVARAYELFLHSKRKVIFEKAAKETALELLWHLRGGES